MSSSSPPLLVSSSSSSFSPLLHLSSFFSGLLDSLRLPSVLIFFFTSRTVRLRTAQCFLLNGLVFLGSIFFIEQIFQPTLIKIITMSPYYEEKNKEISQTQSIDSSISSTVSLSLSLFYSVIWLYPIYLLSFILSSIWYQDIADQTFLTDGHQIPHRSFTFQRWLTQLSEEVYRALLVLFYFLQASLMSLLPGHLGLCLFTLHMAWIYSLYSFEYKWALLGWSLDYRFDYFERRAAYFAGFGFPASLLTLCFPKFIGAGIFAFCFPFFIILAVIAKPQPNIPNQTTSSLTARSFVSSDPRLLLPPRLPIFKYSGLLMNFMLKFIQKRRR
jgi:etoposide-induced 2.4 mRNA